MSHYFHQNTLGTYQLVSELAADPIQMFQSPLFYSQTPYTHSIDPNYLNQSPLQYHEYYNQYYTKFNPYQQQHFAQYQQDLDSTDSPHSWGFDSSLGSEVKNRSEFESNEFSTITSIPRVPTEKTRSNTYGITTTDVDFLKNEVRQMILMTDKIQGGLENINQLLSQNTKMLTDFFSWAARSSSSEPSVVVECPKSCERPSEKPKTAAAMVVKKPATPSKEATPTRKPAAMKDAPMKKTPSKVTAVAQKVAENSFLTYKSYISNMLKQVTLCSDSRCTMFFQTQLLGSGKLYGADKVFEKIPETMNYNLLDRNESKLVRLCVFVFYPGGEIRAREAYTTGGKIGCTAVTIIKQENGLVIGNVRLCCAKALDDAIGDAVDIISIYIGMSSVFQSDITLDDCTPVSEASNYYPGSLDMEKTMGRIVVCVDICPFTVGDYLSTDRSNLRKCFIPEFSFTTNLDHWILPS